MDINGYKWLILTHYSGYCNEAYGQTVKRDPRLGQRWSSTLAAQEPLAPPPLQLHLGRWKPQGDVTRGLGGLHLRFDLAKLGIAWKILP